MNPIFKKRNYINASRYSLPELYLSILDKTAHPFIMKLNNLDFTFSLDGGSMGGIGFLYVFKDGESFYIPFYKNGEFISSKRIWEFMSNRKGSITAGSVTYHRLNSVYAKAIMIEKFGIEFTLDYILNEFNQEPQPLF
jgi:hypothetical protein